MCLAIRKSDTSRQQNLLKNSGGEKTYYKVLCIQNGKLLSPIRKTSFNISKSGYFHSDRKSKALTGYEGTCQLVHQGVHVYNSRRVASSQNSYLFNCIVVPVTCNIKDFVGSGYSESVFTKVRINKKELRKAIEKFNKVYFNKVYIG